MSSGHPFFHAVFPGQGSQYVGMSRSVRDNFPYIKQLFEEGSEAIKCNLLKLCEDGPADELQLTFNAQPAILTTSFSWYSVLRRELGFTPHAGAGHSLGEYTALLAAGAFSFSAAIRLVRERGDLMQKAVPVGKGKMAAVLGLDDSKLKKLCEAASEGEHSFVVPANFNCPGNVIVAGHTGAVDRLEKIATENQELKARKVMPLKVSAPFHCALMEPVVRAFTPHLRAQTFNKLNFPVVFNVDAKERGEGKIAELLIQQIDHPVLWTDCVTKLNQHSPNIFVEPGPGKVLGGLVKRIVDGAKALSIDSIDDFKNFEKLWKENVR